MGWIFDLSRAGLTLRWTITRIWERETSMASGTATAAGTGLIEVPANRRGNVEAHRLLADAVSRVISS